MNSIYFCFFLCSASELLTEAGLSPIFLEYIEGTRLVELCRLFKIFQSLFQATCTYIKPGNQGLISPLRCSQASVLILLAECKQTHIFVLLYRWNESNIWCLNFNFMV